MTPSFLLTVKKLILKIIIEQTHNADDGLVLNIIIYNHSLFGETLQPNDYVKKKVHGTIHPHIKGCWQDSPANVL